MLDPGPNDYILAKTEKTDTPTNASKIAGLEADAAVETGVSKTFTLEAVYSLAGRGYSLDPNPPTSNGLQHEWTYKEPTEGPLLYTSGSGRIIPAKVTATGKYRVECKIYLVKESTDPAKRTKATMTLTRKGRFAAIGGPLKLGVRDPISIPNVPTTTPRLKTWEHLDEDKSKPYYLQYFESGEQIPQLGTASAELNQPEGAKLTLILPTTLEQETADIATTLPKDERILAPRSEFLTATVSGTFFFSFEDFGGGTVTGIADDITSTFRNPAAPQIPLVRTFTARAPKSLGNEPDVSVGYDPGGTWRCGSCGAFRLRDGFGSFMPGVYVQERFATTPAGFVGNIDKQAWLSRRLNGEKVGYRDGIYTYDFPNPANVITGPGWFHLTDNIWWRDNQDRTIPPIVHEFFAATKRNVLGAPGVRLGGYTISLTLGTGPPNSFPGSANQSKTSN